MEQVMTTSKTRKSKNTFLEDRKHLQKAFSVIRSPKKQAALEQLYVFADLAETGGARELIEGSLFSPETMRPFETASMPYPTDPWLRQALKLFEKKWSGKFSLTEYLNLIPEIPSNLLDEDERFPLLILVDQRHGITKSCKLAGLKNSGDDNTFEDFDPKKTRTAPIYWMRCQDGRKNRGKSVRTCRENFTKDEIGLIVHEGIALYLQEPELIMDDFVVLPGSVHVEARDLVAHVGAWDDGPKLSWNWGGGEFVKFGSGSRRE
jgi:hypothetical protein